MSTVAVWLIILCLTVVAMVYIFWNYARIKQMPEGTAEMSELAGIIRSGASAAASFILMFVPIIVFVILQSKVIETMGSSGMKD